MFKRFLDHTDGVFGFSKALSEIADTRAASRISTQSVLWSSVIMQLTRLGSLNAVDIELRLPKKIESLMGKDKPSSDTVGRVFTKISPTALRRLLWVNCYQIKRNKVLDTSLPLKAIGIDGHEFFPTKKRKWPRFCERGHKTKNAEEPEYYFRMVVCNLLNAGIDLPLDAEPMLAGENEVAPARRLVERYCDNYTCFFDVIVADALYMEGPFVNHI